MSKPKILTVDDDRNVTELLRLGLERRGYAVRVENDPTMGLRAALEFSPDLVLLDVQMPFLDGGGVAQQLHENPKTASIPIIFLTSIVQRSQTHEADGDIGGNEFIAKPANIEEVVKRIENRLRR